MDGRTGLDYSVSFSSMGLFICAPSVVLVIDNVFSGTNPSRKRGLGVNKIRDTNKVRSGPGWKVTRFTVV